MTTFQVLGRKAASFLHMSPWVKAWAVPIWCLLGVARLAILGLSFRRLAPRLGAHVGAVPCTPVIRADQEVRAREIGRGIRTISRYTPWDSSCLPQAVVARWLLGLHGIPYALFLGVARDASQVGVDAHAWVVAGRVRVTGGSSFGCFTIVACFVAPELRSLLER